MKKLLIFLFAAVLFPICLSAQQQTAYEKKNAELLSQIKAKWGAKSAENVEATATRKGYEQFQTDIAAVNLLYQLESQFGNTKGYSEEELKPFVWYAEEWKKIQHLKTDFDDIRLSIKADFSTWCKKGEFEKEADFAKRLQSQSQTAFDSICLKQIEGRITIIMNKGTWKKELSPYNSEAESFTVSFKINNIISRLNNVNIPIAQAENFKNNFSDLRFEVGAYNWCFVENSLFPTLVTLRNQSEGKKYQFPMSLKNQQEIKIYFKDLGIENQYLKDFVFKYLTAKESAEKIARDAARKQFVTDSIAAREKFVKDSIEVSILNLKLESVFQDYNKKLLAEPYNLNKSVLNNYNKIQLTEIGNLQSVFDSKVSKIESEFSRLKNTFKEERNRELYKNDILFVKGKSTIGVGETELSRGERLFRQGELATRESETEFDSFYMQGKDIYQAEVEKRTILRKLSDNTKFIEAMDFRNEATASFDAGYRYGSLYPASAVIGLDFSKINADREEILTVISESKDKSSLVSGLENINRAISPINTRI